MEQNNEYFVISEENGILVLTMQAPGNNLMTDEFFRQYEELMTEISKKKKLKGLIIKGSARHFSVGADVGSLAERSSTESETMNGDYDFSQGHVKQKKLVTFLHDLPYPVVSVISGFCIGSGSEIAVNSHIRICEPTARVGQPESTFGILPALGGIARSVEICGLSKAIQLVFTGELIPVQEAYEIGWADIMADKKQGLKKAIDLIEWISANVSEYKPSETECYISEFLKNEGDIDL